jgi:tRNA nucleotidyltransferase (CCA-adding enzyme)
LPTNWGLKLKKIAKFDNQNANRIKISGERIVDELNKILSTDKPSVGFLLYSKPTLDIILPELTALNQVEKLKGHTQK